MLALGTWESLQSASHALKNETVDESREFSTIMQNPLNNACSEQVGTRRVLSLIGAKPAN
jgi:hypothetical protein